MIDDAAQKTKSLIGIASIHGDLEDLGPSDIVIAHTRWRRLRAGRAVAKDGTVPPYVDDPGCCRALRTAEVGSPNTRERDPRLSICESVGMSVEQTGLPCRESLQFLMRPAEQVCSVPNPIKSRFLPVLPPIGKALVHEHATDIAER